MATPIFSFMRRKIAGPPAPVTNLEIANVNGNAYVSYIGNLAATSYYSILYSNALNTNVGGTFVTSSNISALNVTFSISDGAFYYATVQSSNLIGLSVVATTSAIELGVASGVVKTLAGSTQGSTNGIGTGATFYSPSGAAIDINGVIYIADRDNNRIRKIINGVVTTLAGSTAGSANLNGTNATFNKPTGVAVDNNGVIYVADRDNNKIRKIAINGDVTTIAGSTANTSGSTNGIGTNASFNKPSGVAVDNNGVIYVADSGNNIIRRIATNNNVTTLAGAGGVGDFLDGIGISAKFNQPYGVAVGTNGFLYVADISNNRIRKINITTLNVETLAGNTPGVFTSPNGVAVDTNNNVYVADTSNNRIRVINTASNVTTLAGGTSGANDGTGTNAYFNFPNSVGVDANGVVYVGDSVNNRIRVINYLLPTAPTVSIIGDIDNTTVSYVSTDKYGQWFNMGLYSNDGGSNTGGVLVSSYAALASVTSFNFTSLATGYYYATITASNCAGVAAAVSTANVSVGAITFTVNTIAGNNSSSFNDDVGTNASFNNPNGVAIDANGVIYVADTYNNRIRKIVKGVVTTFAGSTSGSNDGIGARFNGPYGVAVDTNGIVYVADTFNNRIRSIATNGFVTTLAGVGGPFGSFANGIGTNAGFFRPYGVAVSTDGILYVADTLNDRIRKITISTSNVETLAGNGSTVFSNGIGTNATFYAPYGVAVGTNGFLYVADASNNRIRKINILSSNVETFAGSTRGSADGTNATFRNPYGLTVDANGIVYVADTGNNRIRRINTSSNVTTSAGGGSFGDFADGIGTSARFNEPTGVAVYDNVLYVADYFNNRVRVINYPVPIAPTVSITGGNGSATVSYISTDKYGQYFNTGLYSNAGGSNTGGVLQTYNYVLASQTSYTFSGLATGYYYATVIAFNCARSASLVRTNNINIILLPPQAVSSGTISDNGLGYADVNFSLSPTATSYSIKLYTSPAGILYSSESTYTSPYSKEITATSNYYAIIVAENSSGNSPSFTTNTALINTLPPPTITTNIVLSYTRTIVSNTIKISFSLNFDLLYTISTYEIKLYNVNNPSTMIIDDTISYPYYYDLPYPPYFIDTRPPRTYNLDSNVEDSSYYFTIRAINRLGEYTTTSSNLLVTSKYYVTTQDTGYNAPTWIVVAPNNNIYFSDTFNNRIAILNGGTFLGGLNRPNGLDVDNNNVIYIADSFNDRILSYNGISMTVIAGGTKGFQDGTGTNARFNEPYGVCIDANGIIYVGDTYNNRIRKIINGVVTTIGTNVNRAEGVCVDTNGVLYVADFNNDRILKMINGTLTPIVGLGISLGVTLKTPADVAVDTNGIVYITDVGNNRICMFKDNTVTVLAGDIGGVAGNQDGIGTNAKFFTPYGIYVNADGTDIYIGDTGNNSIRRIRRY